MPVIDHYWYQPHLFDAAPSNTYEIERPGSVEEDTDPDRCGEQQRSTLTHHGTGAAGNLRSALLADAAVAINRQRNIDYGEPVDNLGRTARLWSVLFGHPVSAADVALAMVLVKVARMCNEQTYDSWKDIAGWAAVGYEVAELEEQCPTPP